MSGLPDNVAREGFALLGVFKNAITFTLALTTLTEITRESPDYLFLMLSTLGIIALTLIIQTEISNLTTRSDTIDEKDKSHKLYYALRGPLKCLSFLTSITLNILTQFLSTMIAKYILTFVPNPSNIYDVSYVLVIVMCLFWCALYSLGIDWHSV